MYNYIKRMGDRNEILEENMEKNSTQNNSLVDGRKRRRYVNEEVEGLGDSNEEVSNEFDESDKKKSLSNTSENNRLVLGGIEKSNVESENNSGYFNLQENKKKQLDRIKKGI